MVTSAISAPSPTLIGREALNILIEHIEREKFLVRDIGSTLEYLYRMKHLSGIEVYKEMHIIQRNNNLLTKEKDFLYIMAPVGVPAPILSREAMTWAGLDRRDPYLDMPRFPHSTLLKDELHTWESYGNKDYLEHNSIGRSLLVEVLRRMPLKELGF